MKLLAKKATALLLVLLMAVSVAACGGKDGDGGKENPSAAPTGTAGQTPSGNDENGGGSAGPSADWDELDAAAITEAMEAGWNVGNQLEASSGGMPSEIAWQSTFITPELIKLVKESGFKTVRVPVSYLGKIDDANNYEIDEKWLERVKQVVDMCIAEDMFVLINIHGDGYKSVQGGWLLPDEANQAPILEKYSAVWTQIAEYFKDYDERLIFESMNEIGAHGTCTPEMYKNINAYNQTFLDAIRQTGGNNDRRWVLIPGYNTNIDETASNENFKIPDDSYLSKDIPSGEHRVMVSVHYYDPWSFCGGETDDATQWGVDADSAKTANWGEEAFLEQQFKKLNDAFVSKGYPVIIGEYGAIDKSKADENSDYFRAYFCRTVCQTAKKYGCIPVYWDNGYNGKYGFALFNRSNYTVTHPDIVNAIVGVYSDEQKAEGNASSIELSETEVTLEAASEPHAVAAKTDTGESAVWTSDDYSVATVSKDGVIYPQTEGTCTITAMCGTAKAECKVTVEAPKQTNVKLYLLETKGWQTCAGDESIAIKEPGTYTLKMNVTKDNLEHIGSFYIKDVQVQDGIIEQTLAKSCTASIDSVTVNGTELTLKGSYKDAGMINGNKQLDFCLLNEWVLGTELITEYEMNGSDYKISGVELSDINEVAVTFTVSEVSY